MKKEAISMPYNKTEKGDRSEAPMKRRGGRRRKKVCVFWGENNSVIDYKIFNFVEHKI